MSGTEQLSVKCRYVNTVFTNPDKSYMVVIYKTVTKDVRKFTAVGAMLPEAKDVDYILKGHKTTHKQYGDQLAVEEVEEIEPQEEDAIYEYLKAAKLPGLGAIRSKQIVNRFGKDTFRILDAEPERLAEIRGITTVKAAEIAEAYRGKKVFRDVVMESKKLGLSAKMANKIYGKFGGEAVDMIKEKPYSLCFIQGIGFESIDNALRRRKDFKPVDGNRLEAAINHVMLLNEMSGHLYLEPDLVTQNVYRLLNIYGRQEEVSESYIKNAINDCVKTNRLAYANKVIYRRSAYESEAECAENVCRLLHSKVKTKDISELIEKFEATLGYKLADKQKEAVQMVFDHPISIITGGSGRGKTTVINAVVGVYRFLKPNADIVLCAPTGRAARRMSESVGESASTIHKLLGLKDEESYEPENVTADCIIIDESSMIDMFLADKLFSAIRNGSRVVLVGDKDQLPSVRAGNVFAEMISCGKIPVTVLDVVYRQAEGNSLIDNSIRMNEGNTKLMFDEHTVFIPCSGEQDIIEEVKRAVAESKSKYKDDEIQILTPFKKSTNLGANNLNLVLQAFMNPAAPYKKELKTSKCVWRINDKTMMLKNREETNNGDTGRITSIINTGDNPYFTVTYDTGVVEEYSLDEANDLLQLNYACTIHKSQGSEYPVVIIPMSMAFKRMLKRNLLYTGVTRAKIKLYLIGEMEAVIYAITHTDSDKRRTYLGYRIWYRMEHPEGTSRRVPLKKNAS